MKKRIIILTAILGTTLSIAACDDDTAADRALDNAPGTYKETDSTVNSNGTNVTYETTTDVSEDMDGDKKAVVKTQKTVDPEGMMNQETSTQTEVIEEDNYGDDDIEDDRY